MAQDLPDLLRQLDGRTVTRFDGTTMVLKTNDAAIIPIEMSLRQRVLSAVAHPNIAYLLLSLGTLALTIELWNPGAILPGVVGGVSLLLAFFAFSVLPVNYAGLLLILFGLLLLVLEIKVTSFGLLTAGGFVSLIFGSMILDGLAAARVAVEPPRGPAGRPRVRGDRDGARAAGRRGPAATTGHRRGGMIGEIRRGADRHRARTRRAGRRARRDLEGDRAVSRSPKGTRVRVTGVDGLTLVVRKD